MFRKFIFRVNIVNNRFKGLFAKWTLGFDLKMKKMTKEKQIIDENNN